MKQYLITVVLCALISACGTTPSNSSKAKNLSTSLQNNQAQDVFVLGRSEYQKWEQNEQNIDALKRAIYFFQQAFEQRPDNVNIQFNLYQATVSLAIVQQKLDDSALELLFSKLSPVVYSEVSAPAFIRFLVDKYAQGDQANTSQLIALIKQAIKQNPYVVNQWIALSELLAADGQVDLAIASAKMANRKAPELASAVFQLGSAFNAKAEVGQCVYEHLPLINQSAQLLARSAKLNPQSNNYAEFAAFQYLRLGLIPIAYQMSKMSFEQQPTYWNGLIYAESSLLMAKYDAVDKAILGLKNLGQQQLANRLTLLSAMAQQDKSKAIKLVDQILDEKSYDFFDIYNSVIADYILEIDGSDSITYNRFKDTDPIVLFLKSKDKNAETVLLAQAKTLCSQSDIEFFIGLKALKNNQLFTAKIYFEKVLNLKAYRQSSYFWSKILLNSDEVKAVDIVFSKMLKQAESGNAKSQYGLAMFYLLGTNVAQNIEQAIYWLEQSSQQSYTDAQIKLADIYSKGRYNTEKDYAKALLLYDKLVEKEVEEGFLGSGIIYLKGLNIESNPTLGIQYLTQAANLNNKSAMIELSSAYRYGQGVEQNHSIAYQWYQKLTSLNVDYGQYMRLLSEYYGQGVVQNKNEAQAGMLELAQTGYTRAQFFVARNFHIGGATDYKKASYWYAKAAKKGHCIALNNLGDMYENGHGVTQDYNKAIELYQKSLKTNCKVAAFSLANVYFRGDGVKANKTRALEYAKIAAQAGIKEAQYQLGVWLTTPENSDKDKLTGLAWLTFVQAKHSDAATYLAQYDTSNFTESDIQQAIQAVKQTVNAK